MPESKSKKINTDSLTKSIENKFKKINESKNLKIGFIVAVVGLLLFVPASFVSLGDGNSVGVGSVGIFIGLIAAYFFAPILFMTRKNKSKNFIKSVIGLSIAGIVALSCLVAVIVDPIAKNARCSSFNTIEEMEEAPLRETTGCRERRKELEAKAEAEKQEQEQARKLEIEQKKSDCSSKNYDWNSSENRCNTDEEQKIVEEKKQCSSKNYDWNSSENRCYTDSEQQAKNAEREAEKKRQEEANRTTTRDLTYDELHNGSIPNACLDALDKAAGSPSYVYPLDEADGYAWSGTATVSSNGSIIEAKVNFSFMWVRSQKVSKTTCTYRNGSATVSGF